jgi:arsenate reductase (glutaredoxin)
LTEKGVDFETINYLEHSITPNTLKDLLRRAGLKPADALRTNAPEYRSLVAGKQLPDDALIRIMTEHPELIQRPIVVRGKKAVLARPAERLADLDL